jgi:hypothetical protein
MMAELGCAGGGTGMAELVDTCVHTKQQNKA